MKAILLFDSQIHKLEPVIFKEKIDLAKKCKIKVRNQQMFSSKAIVKACHLSDHHTWTTKVFKMLDSYWLIEKIKIFKRTNSFWFYTKTTKHVPPPPQRNQASGSLHGHYKAFTKVEIATPPT